MDYTNAETITNDQIRALRTEAMIAGDPAMEAICDQALDYTTHGDQRDKARAVCAEVISDAEAAAWVPPVGETDPRLDALLEQMTTELENWADLPTFGGDEPRCTLRVWSWDATRLIVGTCAEDVRIETREDWEGEV